MSCQGVPVSIASPGDAGRHSVASDSGVQVDRDGGAVPTGDANMLPPDSGTIQERREWGQMPLPSFDGGTAMAAPDAGSAPEWYPCNADLRDYDVTAVQIGGTWNVERAGREILSTGDMQQAIAAAYTALDSGRNSKQSVLVLGSGDVDANAQIRIPSFTVVNLCGEIHVTGTATTSDRSPMYARSATDIDIPHATITGNAQYGMFFRSVSNLHLGQIRLVMNPSQSGLGIRIDNNPSAGGSRVTNIQLDAVHVENTAGHGVETYGVDGLSVGQVDGVNTGDCGLILNNTVNANVGIVDCENCAHVGTGYAALRIANGAGRIGDAWPAGNIHVGNVAATGGGRGIFCVSASGGMTIDSFDIDSVDGSPAIFLENCYNLSLAEHSGTLTNGELYIGHNSGNGAPASNVTVQNITLTNANIREQCQPEGDLGNRAHGISGGSVDLCYED